MRIDLWLPWRLWRLWLFVALFVLGSAFSSLHAQPNVRSDKSTIRGRVTNKAGEPLVGVNILSFQKNVGTATDPSGNYTLEVAPGANTIQFSYVGYETQQRSISLMPNEERVLNVVLEGDSGLLRTVTVTSGKFEKSLGEVTVSLEVLKPQLIENSNTIQVNEVLEKVPSVTLIDGQANIRMGSGYSYGAGSRVLLLVDDLPALQGDAGFPNWSLVPVENIGQVEVLKGAASALYGSSAMNGIINIRTAYPTDEAYTKVSTYGTLYGNPKDERMKWWNDTTVTPFKRGIQIAHRQKINQLDLVAGAAYLRNQSFREQSSEEYGRFQLNTRYRFTDEISAGINATYLTGRNANFFLWANDTTGAYRPLENTISNNDTRKFIIDPYVTMFTGNVRHKLMGRFYDIRNVQGNDVADQTVKSRQYYGEYQAQANLKNTQTVITGGVVGSFTEVDAPLYGDSIYTTTNAAAYVQFDQKLFNKLNLSLGARFERNTISSPSVDATENKPVFRFGANYELQPKTFLRASIGQGYRFPTVAEKYISTALGTIGIFPNDTLISETGWSAEVGVKQGFKIGGFNGYFDAALYWIEYDNMMEFVFGLFGTSANPIDNLGFASQNIGDTRIRGIDLSVAGTGKLFGLPTNVLAGYTYANPTYRNFDEIDTTLNSVNDNILKYRFQHTFKLDYEVFYKSFSLGLAVLTYSHMDNIDAIFEFDFATPGIKSFRDNHNDGTIVTNLRCSYQPLDALKISFLVNNVFNEVYALRPGIMDAPRNF